MMFDRGIMASMVPRAKAKGRGASASASSGDMPLFAAVSAGDCAAVEALLQEALQRRQGSGGGGGGGGDGPTVSHVEIAQTEGEKFTGGHSTPVFCLQADVQRGGGKGGGKGGGRRRKFIAKLVTIAGGDDDPIIFFKRESYANERRFFEFGIAAIIRDAELVIPRALITEGGRDGTDPHLGILMNDLRQTHPYHPEFMDARQAVHALRYAARLHAVFWGRLGRAVGKEDGGWRRQGVAPWEQGCFWTLDKPAEAQRLEAGLTKKRWAETLKWLTSNGYGAVAQRPGIRSLAARVEACARGLASCLEAERQGPRNTLVHGDFKVGDKSVS
jgi:hypothetical protein